MSTGQHMFRLLNTFPETKILLKKFFLEDKKMRKRETEILVQWVISIRLSLNSAEPRNPPNRI
jgi:hypothetical protein